jgi:hypothetical protein
MTPILTSEQVAAMLQVSTDKVYGYIATGINLPTGENVKLAAHNIGSTRRATWRFEQADVVDFMAATRTQQPRQERRADPVRGIRPWIKREPSGTSAHGR